LHALRIARLYLLHEPDLRQASATEGGQHVSSDVQHAKTSANNTLDVLRQPDMCHRVPARARIHSERPVCDVGWRVVHAARCTARLCCAQTEILSGNAAPSNRLASVSLQRTSRYDAMATKIVLDGSSVYGGRVSST
jgi:hypothetical protein